MKASSLSIIACPHCHQELAFDSETEEEPITKANFYCSYCNRHYPVLGNIVRFIEYKELTGTNKRFAHLYDRAAPFYRPISEIAQRVGGIFGVSRSDLIQRLQPQGGRFLEVSIGPGVNLPDFFATSGVDEVFGLDISLGQLQQCQKYCAKKAWEVDLFLGQAEELPFRDNSFDGVLHFGGINFFTDKCAAILEMIRVARSGARIVISDENEKLARIYDWSIPGFRRSFSSKREKVTAPVKLIPAEMKDLLVENLWFGAIYCLSFTKP